MVTDLIDAHGPLAFHRAYSPDAVEHLGYPAPAQNDRKGNGSADIPRFEDAMRNEFETYSQTWPA